MQKHVTLSGQGQFIFHGLSIFRPHTINLQMSWFPESVTQWKMSKTEIFNLPHEGMLQFYCNLVGDPLVWSIFRKHLHRIDISQIVDFPHWPLYKFWGGVSKVTFSGFSQFDAHKWWTSYYNLSNVMDSVCPLSPRPLRVRQAPNSAGRLWMVTENTSRKWNFEIPIGCHGNEEILSRLRYWSDCAEFFMGKLIWQ